MTTSFYLHKETMVMLLDFLARTKRSKTSVINEAIETYIKQDNEKNKMLDEIYHEHLKGKFNGSTY